MKGLFISMVIWTNFSLWFKNTLTSDTPSKFQIKICQKVPSSVVYMPMHSVINESSTTTKLRVVFDASAKSSTGISLNDTLQVGPTICPSLTNILIRFRSFKIAVSSDICKMYRAVELSPSDRDLHRFVWRRDSSTPLSDYRMTRITFGVAASAFAAIRSFQQTTLDCGDEFSLAKPHIFDSFYVNDCLGGADNVEQAFLLQQQLHGLLEKGGFLVRKWRSNSTDVLDSIPQELKESTAVQPIVQEDAYHKTLGIIRILTMMYFTSPYRKKQHL